MLTVSTPLVYFRIIPCRQTQTSICRISETQWMISSQASAVSLQLNNGTRDCLPLLNLTRSYFMVVKVVNTATCQ